MRPLLTFLTLTLLSFHASIGQNIVPATKQEVQERNGITYFQGRPHTGFVYERNASDVMVYKAEYVNGLLHGPYSEKHSNGAKKFDAEYRNGKLDDGIYYVYDRSGQKAEGKVYANGRLTKLEAYQTGRLNGITREYDSNGNVWKEVTYKDGKKDGLEKEMNSSGTVIAERNYVADVQQSFVKLSYHANGKLKHRAECNEMGVEHGIKETYFESGALQKRSKYENGIEASVLTENADPNTTVGKLIGNGRYIYLCDRMNGTDTVYVMVTFNFQGAGTSGEIQANILSSLKSRMTEVSIDHMEAHRNQPVRYELSFNNPKTGTAYEEAKVVFGVTIPPGYRGTASVDCQVKDLKANTTVRSKTLTGQTDKYSDRNTAQNNATSAVKGAVANVTYGFFKVSGKVTAILESNRKGLPTRVEVDLGTTHSMGNGVPFNVYEKPGPGQTKVGHLILQDVLGGYSSRCKVKDGEDVIKRLMDSGRPVYVETNYTF